MEDKKIVFVSENGIVSQLIDAYLQAPKKPVRLDVNMKYYLDFLKEAPNSETVDGALHTTHRIRLINSKVDITISFIFGLDCDCKIVFPEPK